MIHPTAIISSNTVLGKDVKVGPYCCIDGNVKLGDEVELVSHVCISGNTVIGDRTKIYPFASIGSSPQDLKYKGEPSSTIIGQDNTIREYVTIQPGTEHDSMETVVGDHCLMMVGSHIAHDCVVGNHVIMANQATLGGHVKIGDYVIIGGLSAIQQFVRIGAHAIIGGMSGVEKDVVPYAMVLGERATLNGINIVGLRRRGFSNVSIQQIQSVYKKLFEEDKMPFIDRINELKDSTTLDPVITQLIDFLTVDSKRHYCQPKSVLA